MFLFYSFYLISGFGKMDISIAMPVGIGSYICCFFFLKTLDCELISSTVWSMGTLGLQIWGYLSSNASALHLSGTCGTSKKCHYANLTSRGVWYHMGSSLLNSKAREGRPGVSNFPTTENSLQGMWAFLSFLSVFWGSFLFSLPFHYR